MKSKTSMTLDQLAEKAIEDIKAMTPDERAHVRAKLKRELLPKLPQKIYKM
jgi:hypothetical protein